MAPKPIKGEYIETDTGNKVSRRAQVHGTQHIILGGKTVIQAEVCIRGDLHRLAAPPPSPSPSTLNPSSATSSSTTSAAAPSTPSVAVTIGRYTHLSRGALLRPPSRLHRGIHSYFPLKIGDHVFIGERAIIEAASVGNHVQIGAGAVVGAMAILKDYVVVLEGAVVPGGMVVPSWSVVGGRPARVVGEVGEGWGVEGGEGGLARERYRSVGR
ncbi:hypothetical protein AJ80_07980 [Polytolypa hystricis UAMH7299]|uniref:Dynactin subunit 5 n=1 Tax=Polytolypa hystricis (strain UAMH7299) TaxID=1447883 RepID=A0A2B7XFP8_POLH7|nr:hypothetical protein AJ80_07980 [Polytolypa hystricis UAMH7299]